MPALKLVEKPVILLVDDNEDVREAFADLLRTEGYRVETAKNGQAALDELTKGLDPVLIFLDMNMPVMTGEEFIRAKREKGLAPSTPVVVFAAQPPEAPIEGVARLIRKPVDPDVLLDTVEKFGRLPVNDRIASRTQL